MSEITTNAEVFFCEHCGRELTADEVCELDGVQMCLVMKTTPAVITATRF